MVMPVGPVKFVCTHCGWFKRAHFKTDRIYKVVSVCPKCGNENFEMQKDDSKRWFTFFTR